MSTMLLILGANGVFKKYQITKKYRKIHTVQQSKELRGLEKLKFISWRVHHHLQRVAPIIRVKVCA